MPHSQPGLLCKPLADRCFPIKTGPFLDQVGMQLPAGSSWWCLTLWTPGSGPSGSGPGSPSVLCVGTNPQSPSCWTTRPSVVLQPPTRWVTPGISLAPDTKDEWLRFNQGGWTLKLLEDYAMNQSWTLAPIVKLVIFRWYVKTFNHFGHLIA